MNNSKETKTETPVSFEDQIKTSVNEIMASTDIQEVVKSHLKKGIENAIENSFKWGDLSKTVENKIKEYLVPYIEKYDMSEFIPKMDTVLTQIVNETTLTENKRLLENFKNLMIEPRKKVINIDDIFAEYCKYVAANVDTSELEVICEDRAYYESVTCKCDVEETSKPYSYYKELLINFTTDDAKQCEYGDPINFSLAVKQSKDDTSKEYKICPETPPSIESLRLISDFEVYLMKLQRAGVKVMITEYPTAIEEDVDPDAEPEASYS